MILVIATKNAGKLAEFKAMLAGMSYTIKSLADYPHIPEIEETGTTFAENAAIKAETIACLTGELALADDSGLEVDALGGRPGIYSARYAQAGTDLANNHKLLQEMEQIADEARTARFRTVIAIAQTGKSTSFAEGTCEGLIAHELLGPGGFGYDPLFFVPAVGKTFGQIPAAIKNKISHRAQAMTAALAILTEIAQKS